MATITYKHNIIDIKPKELLEYFLESYCKYVDKDLDLARELIQETLSYYKSNKPGRDELLHLQSMENKWYDALNKGEIDYSVYGDEYYFTDLWACWSLYSRLYLRSLVNNRSLNGNESVFKIIGDSKSVADLGCGVGLTTSALKQMFGGETYGTNLRETEQFGFCKMMSDTYDFNLVGSVAEIGKEIDLVFASEYFEHILNPYEHLHEVIDTLNPKYLVIANAFNTRSIGHFYEYHNTGEHITKQNKLFENVINPNNNPVVNQKDAAKLFNKMLTNRGYSILKTKIWNNRPYIWVRNDIQ